MGLRGEIPFFKELLGHLFYYSIFLLFVGESDLTCYGRVARVPISPVSSSLLLGDIKGKNFILTKDNNKNKVGTQEKLTPIKKVKRKNIKDRNVILSVYKRSGVLIILSVD